MRRAEGIGRARWGKKSARGRAEEEEEVSRTIESQYIVTENEKDQANSLRYESKNPFVAGPKKSKL